MNPIRTREKALYIVDAVEHKGSYVSDLLSRASSDRGVNYPLLQTLVKGTLEWRARIDAQINKLLKKRRLILAEELRNIVRLAAYQFMFLERVPHVLVITESVALAKKRKSGRDILSLKLILRALLESAKEEPESTVELKSAKGIAQHYSHPLWVVKRWMELYGAEETCQMCAANNKRWPVSIRTNTLKISTHQLRKRLYSEYVKFEESPYVEECSLIKSLPSAVRLTDLDSFSSGLFQVQDESAALVSHLVDPRPGEFVIDLCAAPGGKATHMATLMRNKGRLLAIDLNETRLDMVKENCARLGLRIVKTLCADATKYQPKELADRVLIDVPCSGLGVLGRKSDIRWSKSPEKIKELVVLQGKIIRQAAKLVRPGGRLVYSTCTIEPEENEQVVAAFLSQHKNFKLEKNFENINKTLLTKDGFFRAWPHKHGIAGAFAAVMTRCD